MSQTPSAVLLMPVVESEVSMVILASGLTASYASLSFSMTGDTETFALNTIESKIMVGKIGVDISKLESVGVSAIKQACEECDIIIIDEVGKIEVESELFCQVVKDALDVDKPMILTLHKKSRNPLLQDIRRRDDVRILEVTPTNRALLPHKIVRLMNGENI